MDFDSIRPILSGVAGGVIATWLTTRLARSLPESYNAKPRDVLLRQHRVAVHTANALFLAGLFLGVALYPLGGFANTDATPLLWGFGLASVLPLVALYFVSVGFGRSAKEAYVAFAIGQGAPIWMTYGILGAGVVAFLFAVARALS